MSFLLFLLYVASAYIFPGELYPALAPYRIPLWVGIVAVVFSAVRHYAKGGSPTGLQLFLLRAFSCSLALSTVVADHWFGGALVSLQDFAPSFIMFLLAIWNLDSLRKFRILTIIIVLLSGGLALQGIAAFHFGYNSDQLLLDEDTDKDSDDPVKNPNLVRIRGLGIMNDPNDLALGLISTLPLLALAWRPRRRIHNLTIVILPLSILVYGLYLTRSRGAALSLLIVVLMGFSARLGRIRATVLASALVVGSMAVDVSGGREFSAKEDSAAARLEAWSEGLLMLKEQPLFGVGYHGFVDHHEKTAHNSFVLCFAELGLFGYFFWMALLVVTFLELIRIGHLPNDDVEGDKLKRWARALSLSLLGILAAAFFLSRTYVVTLYLILGMAAALAALGRKQGSSIVIPGPFRLTRLVSAWEFGSIVFMYLFIRINNVFVY